MRSFRYCRRGRCSRAVRTICFVFLLWNILEVFYIRSRLRGPSTAADFPTTRVYIASLHWNNEAVLRNHWNKAVLDLARVLGPSNIFVSIYESGSWDNTADALRYLDSELKTLGVGRHIELNKTTHQDEISATPPPNATGWVDTPRGRRELRRIPFLSRLRNKSLEPLRELARQSVTFDKVLFLNDVVFTVDDILSLLQTNDGSYAAACALDFSSPPKFYDTFALRDSDGHEYVTYTWPYFRSYESRRAMKRSLPVPARSCWNGMVSMPANLFTSQDESQVLSFRGIDDTLASYHLEGSECCLIHADNPLSASLGVYLNPDVRVAYSGTAYEAVHPPGHWLTSYEILVGLWKNRIWRWFTTPAFKEWRVRKLVKTWEAGGPRRVEAGRFCLVNEMQVLVENGWVHV